MSSIWKVALVALAVASAHAYAAPAPLVTVTNPGDRIVDSAGHTLHIVDLKDDAVDGFSDEVNPADRGRFAARHSGRAINLVASFERALGVEHVGMTSWVGYSFSAYLTPGQVKQLRENPLVTLVTESRRVSFSATPPPWQESTSGSETYSWGRAAIGGRVLSGQHNISVYVLDNGVGMHDDLNNVERVAPTAGVVPIGCYSHGTHVAGIIGASYGNNSGTAGILAGVHIVSVSVLRGNLPLSGTPVCGDPSTLDTTGIATALDYVRSDIPNRLMAGAAVVNMSFNDPTFAPGGTLNTKVLSLATPDPNTGYMGALITQSAGNQWELASAHAYSLNNVSVPNDGIMVVGGIDQSGSMVQPPNPGDPNSHGYVNMPNASDERGSNFGPAIDVWAPSKSIVSTWGNLAGFDRFNSATWQRSDTFYSNTVRLSGTSMAAPHIAGVAAAILVNYPFLNSRQLETAVRNYVYTLGQLDTSCGTPCPVNLVAFPTATLTNVSARVKTLTGNDVAIMGLSLGGTKSVGITALGPSLAPFGISDFLANPTFTLVRSSDGAVIGGNDNWQTDPNASLLTSHGMAPGNSLESGSYVSLAPGNYTMIVAGVGNTTGVTTIGITEGDHPESPIMNYSIRGKVLTGNDVMIGGFVVSGNGPLPVVLRATGPSLVPFGITDALANPTLTLVRQSDGAVIGQNDDWASASNQDMVQAMGLAPSNISESAILTNLQPGAYTAIVQGVGGFTGVSVFSVDLLH